MKWKSRVYCGVVTSKYAGKEIVLYGWVDTIRNHGQLLFMHLRDVKGVVQLVFDPLKNQELYQKAETLRSEDVIEVEGIVLNRDPDAVNPNLATGSIEVQVTQLVILSEAQTPPFMITEKGNIDDQKNVSVDEDLRLKYRYLDLRRPSMQQHLIKRDLITRTIRHYLSDQGFLDIETPFLTKSTPEGARDYLVPSRHHEGRFYALPQSPQLFKQLLMMSGFDRYFQIVKCFRDEDLRPNRQPEFTQLDIEASFIDETFIYELIEGLIVNLFALNNIHLPRPFPHLLYQDAYQYYGSDKPDLRFDLKMVDVSSLLSQVQFKIFRSILDQGGLIKAINIKGKSLELSKTYLQEELAKTVIPSLGGKGMAWMRVEQGHFQSNIVQFFTEVELQQLRLALHAEEGDVCIFIADVNHQLVHEVLGKFRLYIAEKLNLIDKSKWAVTWVTHFPLFELKNEQLTSVHHPFTQPDQLLNPSFSISDLLKVKARAYDLVINGEEIGGGSIRIHRMDMQETIFKLLGMGSQEIEEKFGFFVKALSYGAPPHGGIALGIDRLVGMLSGTDSIREVIAFPKNRVAFCPLTQAPDLVSKSQLDDLNIQLKSKG